MRIRPDHPLREKHRLLTLLFILSEATFFAFLILAYVYFRTFPVDGPSAESSLDVAKTGFFSLFLFGSSLTIWLGEKSLHKGNPRGFTTWLAVTIALGLVFLAGPAPGGNGLIHHGASLRRNLFRTTF